MRRLRRAAALALALAISILRYWFARLSGPMTLERRAVWLQEAARRVIASLGIASQVEGEPPSCGLVVSNHLSYLDIPIISAAMPCFFVSRADVAGWPVFGKAARVGGTLFLDRSSLASANVVSDQIVERLAHSIPVLLFPEGTSTDGAEVLRFHSRLIHPATEIGAPVTAAAIRYEIQDGPHGPTPECELCWYGDETFVNHLWKVLGAAHFTAYLRFGEPRIYRDRRIAADLTHDAIVEMREEVAMALS